MNISNADALSFRHPLNICSCVLLKLLCIDWLYNLMNHICGSHSLFLPPLSIDYSP